MKKISIVLCLVLVAASASYAQELKKFRVGIGLGYASAGGNGSSGGVLFAVEPSYRIQDNLSVGLRMESALITRGFSGTVTAGTSFDVAAIGSYTLNGQYYFGESSFRPFVGAGLGIYSLAAVKVTAGGASGNAVAAESKFGFYPRVGFDYGHFNLSIDYNLVPSSAITGITETFTNNYLGIRLGAYFGGGKK
jgi:Outer membrane protein beta-barrel domain